MDALANGNFETGTLDGWDTLGATQLVGDPKHFGRYAAALGNANNADDELCQFVAIPTDTVAATLSFWWYMISEQVSHPRDYLYVEVWDQEGVFLANLTTVSDADEAGIWKPSANINLLSYAGQNVWICFIGMTDGREPTAFFLDDIHLSLCTAGAAPQPAKAERRPAAKGRIRQGDPIPLFNVASIHSDQTGWVYSNAVLNTDHAIMLPLITKP